MKKFIQSHKDKKIDIKTIEKYFAQKHPNLAKEKTFPNQFKATLKNLSKQGILLLPPPKHYGHRILGLPDYVLGNQNKKTFSKTLIESKKKKEKKKTTIDISYNWLPCMRFAEELGAKDREVAGKINYWLLNNSKKTTWLSLNERSLEITGCENTFKKYANSNLKSLFRGKLSFECIKVQKPLKEMIYREFYKAKNSVILISENYDSYGSLCTWNEQKRNKEKYKAIFFGDGTNVSRNKEFLEYYINKKDIQKIEYIGDIDLMGLMIPWSLSQKRVRLGQLPIQPAYDFYKYMIQNGVKQGKKVPNKNWQTGLNWFAEFDDFYLDELEAIFNKNKYIAQETINMDVLNCCF